MAGSAPAQAQSPVKGNTAPAIPFALASRKMTRQSFQVPVTAFAAASTTPISPIQLPAVGFLSHVLLHVVITASAADANITFTADAPFNALSVIEFRTAAGNDIIVPMTGYQAMLMAKYGAQFAVAPMSDPRAGFGFNAGTKPAAANAVVADFYLPISLQIDAATAYGSIPALASNRSYQLNLTLAALSTFGTAATATYSANITGTAYYWSEPPATTASGASQATAPTGIGTVSQWQIEQPPVTPGDKYIKSNNVGNVIRTLIFTLRTAAGVRTDTDFPAVSELYLDNEPMFYLPLSEWSFNTANQYGLQATGKDVKNGLDTGVYVIPFHALAGGRAGDPQNSRAQLLPTVDGSQLQLRGTSFGANASTLEIITNSVIPTDAATLYSR